MRLLLVEDDLILGDGVCSGLSGSGFRVEWVRDAASANRALDLGGFDLVLLDLGLPGEDGLSLLRRLRGSGNRVPVIIVTARDTLQERIGGLDTGADDYLVKPFDLDELAARVRAVVRRHQGRADPEIRHGELVVNPAARTVYLAGEEISLTGFEFVLLEALLESCGRVMTRERLEELLYGWDESIESNTLEVHIHHLRKKLGKELIRTIRGVGYMIPTVNG